MVRPPWIIEQRSLEQPHNVSLTRFGRDNRTLSALGRPSSPLVALPIGLGILQDKHGGRWRLGHGRTAADTEGSADEGDEHEKEQRHQQHDDDQLSRLALPELCLELFGARWLLDEPL